MSSKRTYKSRRIWSDAEEATLCNVWANKVQLLRDSRRNSHVVEEMVMELRAHAIVVTGEEIRTKIHNLSAKYKKEKVGESPSTWSLYETVHSILENLEEEEQIPRPICKKIYKRTKTPLKKQMKKKKLWSTEEEEAFCEVWGDKIEMLRAARKNSHIVEEMRINLDEACGIEVSIEEIRTKMHNLTAKYKLEKMNVDASGGEPSTWNIYQKVHSILGSFDVNNLELSMDQESISASTFLSIPKMESGKLSGKIMEFDDDNSMDFTNNTMDFNDTAIELNDNICRICLGDNIILNWNEEILENCEITYKTCYYKCTQLKAMVLDPYSEMLCKNCSDDLKTSYFLVKKALESHKILKQTYSNKTQIDGSVEITKCDPDEYETSILNQSDDFFMKETMERDTNDSTNDDALNEFEMFVFGENEESFIKNERDTISTTNALDKEDHGAIPTIPKHYKKRRLWSVKEEEALCEVWGDKIDILRSLKKNAHIVDEMRIELEKIHKIVFSYEEIKFKIHNLSSKYRQEKANVEASGGTPSKWNLYHKVHLILRSFEINQQKSKEQESISQLSNKSEHQTKKDLKEESADHEESEIKCKNKQKLENRIKNESEDDSQNPSTSKKIAEKKNGSDSDELEDSKDNTQISMRKTYKYMCSICSKIYQSKRSLKIHEESHTKERERLEMCPICGLKLYDKLALDVHLMTHNAMREKKYKCEFCNKAYLASGALNIHRRIHLGTMIPCPICPKKFYRPAELKRHKFVAHSTVPYNADVTASKIKSKYYAYCKICDKSLRSSSWRAHQASHLKDPLMQCSMCGKDFFSRSTCVYHMQRTHNFKTKDEYEPFIIYFKGRFSHLLMQQQCELQLGSAM